MKPWSAIQKQFRGRHFDSVNLSRIESLLKELGEVRVNAKEVKLYGLKKQFLSEWDRYFVEYDHTEQSKAYENVTMMTKKDPESVKAGLSLAKMKFELCDRFEPVLHLLDCDMMRETILLSLKHRLGILSNFENKEAIYKLELPVSFMSFSGVGQFFKSSLQTFEV